jgi:hypothetical protein
MQKMEFTAAGEGPASDADIFSAALKNVFGAKIRLVTGYPGGAEMALAIEREEVEGRCGWSWSSIKSTRPTWVPEKKLIPFLVLSLRKNPELPDVPVVTEFANAEQMQLLKLFLSRQEMGRPYAAPPGVPKAIQGLPSRSAKLGESVVRGRLPGASELGRPGFSQDICARVPIGKPKPGTTGEDCSHPPEGVAETMLPCWSITSTWQVSPPLAPRRATVGSPAP